jgi:hypothetical protein
MSRGLKLKIMNDKVSSANRDVLVHNKSLSKDTLFSLNVPFVTICLNSLTATESNAF